MSGEFKERDNLPEVVNRLPSSVLIDLPNSNIEEYLSKLLSLEKLLQDDILVEFIEK